MQHVTRNSQETPTDQRCTTDVTFGGVSILAVGYLYQLPPVGQRPVFSCVSDSYAKLCRSGSLWVDEFQMIELDEIMRQKDDSEFCELMCRIRTADQTEEDIVTFQSRPRYAQLS